MSMTHREATIERAYAALTADERTLVDKWSTLDPADRSYYWATVGAAVRRVIYMLTDGRPGLLS